jgi:hypothetical protein
LHITNVKEEAATQQETYKNSFAVSFGFQELDLRYA